MNQQNQSDDNKRITIEADLPLTNESAEQVKAGEGREANAPSISEIVVTKHHDSSSSALF